MRRNRAATFAIAALLPLCLALSRVAPAADAPSKAPATASNAVAKAGPCLPSGDGRFRARLRGALDLDIAWDDPRMECDGGARPDGRGLRVTIAGPANRKGRRTRFVFGIEDVPEGATVSARPTNLTVIFEGEQRVYATRGTDKCTIDELRQERLATLGGGRRRSWRVVARGFCIGPATALDADARLLVTRFDFASQVNFGEDGAHAPAPTPRPP